MEINVPCTICNTHMQYAWVTGKHVRTVLYICGKMLFWPYSQSNRVSLLDSSTHICHICMGNATIYLESFTYDSYTHTVNSGLIDTSTRRIIVHNGNWPALFVKPDGIFGDVTRTHDYSTRLACARHFAKRLGEATGTPIEMPDIEEPRHDILLRHHPNIHRVGATSYSCKDYILVLQPADDKIHIWFAHEDLLTPVGASSISCALHRRIIRTGAILINEYNAYAITPSPRTKKDMIGIFEQCVMEKYNANTF